MKLPVFVILITILWLPLYGQTPSYNISGIVTDEHQSPAPGVSILLQLSGDSTIRKIAISGKDGKFIISELKEGKYVLVFRAVGYNIFKSEPITLDAAHSSVQMSPVQLLPGESKTLKEVAVTARKPLLEQEVDKLVVNVEAFITGAGTSALDILSKSPGVTVTEDNGITFNGRGGVLILIDGRQTYLSGQDLANYLKSIPSANLDKVELMSNPPAKYDAAGTSVINIRTKKIKILGFNGNLSANYGQGAYWRSNDAISVNYRNNKVNLFANANYGGDRNFVDATVKRYYFNKDGSPASTILMDANNLNRADPFSARAGLDFFAGPNTTFGIALNGMTRNSGEKVTTISRVYDKAMSLDSTAKGYLDGRYKWKNGGINLNFQQKLDSAGREVTGDLDYIRYDSHGDQLFNNLLTRADGSTFANDLLGTLPTRVDIYSAKTDYSHPIRRGRFEAGLKSSYVKTDNEAVYFNRVDGETTPDYNKTNRFQYKENINAAYVNFNREFKWLTLQVGMRVENTIAQGHQLGNKEKPDSSFKKNYTDVFPTAYLMFKLDSANDNTLSINYSRRISRPAYQDLNPFLFYMDQFTYRAGNPFLKAAYTNRIELMYRFKRYFTATAFYDHANDMIMQTVEQTDNFFIDRNANIGKSDNIGILTNVTLDPAKWWMLNLHADYIYSIFKSDQYVDDLNQRKGSFLMSAFNQFRFKKGWSTELFLFYRSGYVRGQFLREPIFRTDVGVQKTILKDKGSIRFNVQDVWYSTIPRGQITAIRDVKVYDRNLLDSRVFGLTFGYRFGREPNSNRRNRRTGGAESEQGRVNTP